MKKAMEHEVYGDTSCNWCTWIDPQRLSKRSREVGNWRTNGDHLNYSIVEVGQNTEKSPGDLRRLSATQPLVKDNQLMLVQKNLQGVISKDGDHSQGGPKGSLSNS